MGVFGVFIVLGIVIFSAYKGSSKPAVTVTMWGTISENTFSEIIQKTSLYQSKELTIKYTQKSGESFDADFIEALASGKGPDIFMLPSDKLLKHRNKIFAIPYKNLTQRQFKDAFVEGSEIYMAPEGTLALPIAIDPLVMYWNRSMFTEVNITQPPKYWDEFYNLANTISKKDGALNISKSAVAFGEFSNITHAKEIILNLAMQAGTPIIVWSNGSVRSVFGDSFGKAVAPAIAAVNFYTEFSNPSKPSYSWNRSLPNSVNYFLGGDLALYFGFASEIANLQLKNPNLNFDVAPVPTEREGGTNVSFVNFNALAITKSSKNPVAAYSVISILADKNSASSWSSILKLPPARRDLLSSRPIDAFQSVFYNSAIRGKAWLDPSLIETNTVFGDMINSITSGRARTEEAVSKASRELSSLLSK